MVVVIKGHDNYHVVWAVLEEAIDWIGKLQVVEHVHGDHVLTLHELDLSIDDCTLEVGGIWLGCECRGHCILHDGDPLAAEPHLKQTAGTHSSDNCLLYLEFGKKATWFNCMILQYPHTDIHVQD